MLSAHVRPSRDLRNHYADMVRTLNQHDHIIITNNGVGESVLIGIKDYDKYEEFVHHRFIYEELQKSKEKSLDPNAQMTDAETVFSNIEKKLEGRGL